MNARLLLSVSGLTDRTVEDCAEFAARMTVRGVPLSFLVAPRPPGRPGLGAAAPWLAARTGDAVLLHGYDHTAPVGYGAFGRRAEFATLPAHEAGLRLTAATVLLERLGLGTDLFAPPRWLASPGTVHALRRRRFALCADATAIRDLRGGAVHRGRVLGLPSTARAEPWWCRALVIGAARQARRRTLVRLAVDAADLCRSGPRQAILDAVDIALHHGALPCTYRALCTGPTARAAA